ncbi:hypothetical protein J7J60_02765 [bacterium]|nr:hypothetical protein [bacterium]
MLGKGWWKQDIPPLISIIILTIALCTVFFMGMSFVIKYLEILTKAYYGG